MAFSTVGFTAQELLRLESENPDQGRKSVGVFFFSFTLIQVFPHGEVKGQILSRGETQEHMLVDPTVYGQRTN